MDLIEQINNSGLFPYHIKQFLVESVKNGELNEVVKEELQQMLIEEKRVVKKIDNKKEKEIEDLQA